MPDYDKCLVPIHTHIQTLEFVLSTQTFFFKTQGVVALSATECEISHLASMMLELGLLVPGPVGLHLIV